jgi:hypothetical protein
MSDIWKDPMVKAALKERGSASDVAVLRCPRCTQWGYYNEGSHFTCRHCRKTWYVCSEEEPEPIDGRPSMRLDGHTTLADTLYEDGAAEHC